MLVPRHIVVQLREVRKVLEQLFVVGLGVHQPGVLCLFFNLCIGVPWQRLVIHGLVLSVGYLLFL